MTTEGLSNEQLRLHMGELTAEECRVARAAITWTNRRAEQLIDKLVEALELSVAALEDLGACRDENCDVQVCNKALPTSKNALALADKWRARQ